MGSCWPWGLWHKFFSGRRFTFHLRPHGIRAFADQANRHLAERKFGFWAAERLDGRDLIGFIGLGVPGFEAPFMPCVEIGWRLKRGAWGRGFASEGAKGVLAYAWGELGLGEVVAYTTVGNFRSIKVMERIGMIRDRSCDFEHPKLPPGDPLRSHLLFRVSRPPAKQSLGAA